MAARTKPKASAKSTAEADAQAMRDADAFLRWATQRNVAQKKYDAAKESLRGWLGKKKAKPLPDGRTVVLSTQPYDEYTVGAGTKALLTISPALTDE